MQPNVFQRSNVTTGPYTAAKVMRSETVPATSGTIRGILYEEFSADASEGGGPVGVLQEGVGRFRT